jgi:PEP-CTERM motif
MILRRVVLPAICLLVIALSSAAYADTWTYTFSGTNSAPGGDGVAVAFQFSTQAPVTTNTWLLSSQLISCTNCLVSSFAAAVVFQPSNVFGSSIDFADLNSVNAYMFPFGAFTKPGTYVSVIPFNPGTLTVQVVPEPSSVLLFLPGFAALCGVARRKLGLA